MTINLSDTLVNINNRFVRSALESLQDAVNALPETPSGWNDTGSIIKTLTASDSVRIDSFFDVFASVDPGVSAGGSGRIYFDSGANKFKVSENGDAFVNLLGAPATQLDANGDILDVDSIPDGTLLFRSGSSVVGITGPA